MHIRNVGAGIQMITLLTNLILFIRKDDFMMGMLWAQQIMLGKKEFKDVPRLLKEQVKEILVDSGMGELAE